jgi:hypothetical protein
LGSTQAWALIYLLLMATGAAAALYVFREEIEALLTVP